MSDPFESSRRKIARAKKHIGDLKEKIDTFFERNDLYEPFIEAHPEKAGYGILKVRFTQELPEEFAEIAGDALNNLRSALDSAVHSVAVAAGKPKPGNAYFPFSRDATHFEANLKGRCADVPPEMYPLFRACHPYDGGNQPLWALNVTRGSTEHALLVPGAVASFISGMNVRGTGFISMPYKPVMDRTKREIELATVAPDAIFHGDYQIAIYVAFGEISSIAGENAGELLQFFAELVETIVNEIVAESHRLGIVKEGAVVHNSAGARFRFMPKLTMNDVDVALDRIHETFTKMEHQHQQEIGALGGALLDLYSRQIAMFGLLRSQPPMTEELIRSAVREAQQQLMRIQSLATFRSQASAQRLEELERTLRTMLFPTQKQ
jgi:hypothetical protein